ncbi:hypothetical protein CC1_05160 [Coprococcus catus GD/7]|uniref:Uncharacterized protein n=1 Tax=Coprococcus catus GD/7 TaxID=717962 RepID=D4J503_9FIRM|nr:hypothetical protein CC1_05160 [Coprococcus catus GD/7]
MKSKQEAMQMTSPPVGKFYDMI